MWCKSPKRIGEVLKDDLKFITAAEQTNAAKEIEPVKEALQSLKRIGFDVKIDEKYAHRFGDAIQNIVSPRKEKQDCLRNLARALEIQYNKDESNSTLLKDADQENYKQYATQFPYEWCRENGIIPVYPNPPGEGPSVTCAVCDPISGKPDRFDQMVLMVHRKKMSFNLQQKICPISEVRKALDWILKRQTQINAIRESLEKALPPSILVLEKLVSPSELEEWKEIDLHTEKIYKRAVPIKKDIIDKENEWGATQGRIKYIESLEETIWGKTSDECKEDLEFIQLALTPGFAGMPPHPPLGALVQELLNLFEQKKGAPRKANLISCCERYIEHMSKRSQMVQEQIRLSIPNNAHVTSLGSSRLILDGLKDAKTLYARNVELTWIKLPDDIPSRIGPLDEKEYTKTKVFSKVNQLNFESGKDFLRNRRPDRIYLGAHTLTPYGIIASRGPKEIVQLAKSMGIPIFAVGASFKFYPCYILNAQKLDNLVSGTGTHEFLPWESVYSLLTDWQGMI